MTLQRKTILNILRQTNCHPSADELYELVRKQLPRISLGTVYRNLEVLAKTGLIQKLELGGTIKRFDWNPNKH
ncbi:MAG: transcriptional repressor, partial [Proteobacteria bacterium]|nr:transcriptional repressor [Pseudomonadota bacterium]